MKRTTYAALIILGILTGALAAAKAQVPGTCVMQSYTINGKTLLCTVCYLYGGGQTTSCI